MTAQDILYIYPRVGIATAGKEPHPDWMLPDSSIDENLREAAKK